MESLKKKRASIRRSVTKSINECRTELANDDVDRDVLEGTLEALTERMANLSTLDEKITEELATTGSEDDLALEMEIIDKYSKEYSIMKAKVIRALKATQVNHIPEEAHNQVKKYKLPKVELRKFNGEIRDWLGFWSQFTQIHGDTGLLNVDKFHYLLQALEVGTEARRIAEGYPVTNNNYEKVVEALRDRFGREDLLLQVYVRDLLKLIITNVTTPNKMSLTEMHLQLEANLRSLESLQLSKADPATWLFPLVESSLPDETLRTWQRSSMSKRDGSQENPVKNRLDILMEFIKAEVQAEQHITIARGSFVSEIQKPTKNRKDSRTKIVQMEDSSSTAASLFNGQMADCIFCGRRHDSKDCGTASKMSYESKREKIKESNACYVCLKRGHGSRKCKTFVQCLICKKKHVTLMCKSLEDRREEDSIDKGKDSTKENVETSASQANFECSGDVLLKTVIVSVSNNEGGPKRRARLLFDDGSQRSYISENTVKAINSKPVGEQMVRNILFDGTVTKPQLVRSHSVILSTINGNVKRQIILRERPILGGRIPQVPNGKWIKELESRGIQITDHIQKSPVATNIDVVIGSDFWGDLMEPNSFKLTCGLTATKSIFGWTLSGRVPRFNLSAQDTINMFMAEEEVTKLWNLELIGVHDVVNPKTKVEEEQAARRFFRETTNRDCEGRYCVKLPWVGGSPPQNLPSNRKIAESRLMSTTRKLENMGKLADYSTIFASWLEEGLIEITEEAEGHYLPHHPVYKESLTTPVRPVFDSGSKCGRAPSLNECLYKGPNCIEILPAVLLRFREHHVGVVADIRKAFQMIAIQEDDRKYVKFLWWADKDKKKIQVYKHARVVFGVNSSPYLLAAVLHLHLENVAAEDLPVAKLIRNGMYVDNLVMSLCTTDEYQHFKREAIRIMNNAKMDLRQWECSMLNEQNEKCEVRSSITHVLGILWEKGEDTLSLDVKVMIPDKLTKRSVLSVLHKVFDPIGFSCPALVPLKLIIQRLWKRKGDWDSELKEEEETEFVKWVQDIEWLNKIKIPRHCQISDASRKELHVFCDASQSAYATVAYLKSESTAGVKVQLLQAKSRISPPKQPTIPRMELLACLLGAKLGDSVRKAIDLKEVQSFYWSDSTTAVAWIKGNDEWGTFVGNRVKTILSLTRAQEWRHVPGVMNPADLPSRGCGPKELFLSNWWEGTDWLPDRNKWPSSEEQIDEVEVLAECKRVTAAMTNEDQERWYKCKYSSFFSNVRVIGWVSRFARNCKLAKDIRFIGDLGIEELRQAETTLLRIIQEEGFGVSPNVNMPTKIMDDGLFHVKTAITNREDEEEFRFPILLPKAHSLVDSLIMEIHIKSGHGGTQFMMGLLREKYWIVQTRRTITRVLRKCMVCQRFNVKKADAESAALPEVRVTTGEPFQTTGVDLAGPLFVRDGHKAWIVLFTCAVYRCVYLDLVTSLDSDSFVMCLERMISNCGRPNTMMSDNGTNFVGAINLFNRLDWTSIEDKCKVKKLRWIRIPPTAAWWGGWWERLVKSVKILLRKMLGRAKLNYEELRTCLSSVGNTINERPLTTLTEDPLDLRPLKPVMFMRGLKEASFPEVDQITVDVLRGRARKLAIVKDALNARFRREYLGLLVRIKFTGKEKPVKIGQIVLVGDENRKRYEWPLGRITRIFPGKDKHVRVAEVKTQSGLIIRPIQRLYLLEMADEEIPNEVKVDDRPENNKVDDTVRFSRCGRILSKPSRYGVWNS